MVSVRKTTSLAEMMPQVVNHSTLENKAVQINHENHKTDGISPLKFMHSTT